MFAASEYFNLGVATYVICTQVVPVSLEVICYIAFAAYLVNTHIVPVTGWIRLNIEYD